LDFEADEVYFAGMVLKITKDFDSEYCTGV
jgi:hypothetical protein